jgi:hypothetical protein
MVSADQIPPPFVLISHEIEEAGGVVFAEAVNDALSPSQTVVFNGAVLFVGGAAP